uniref:Auxin and ethylene responsive GH3 n=1 Tax=Solanum tuberosum TaxID=4113 RepID=M1B5N3_SOLTU
MTGDSILSSPLGSSACEKDAKILQFIEEITRIVDAVQQSVLYKILPRNSQIEYLSDHLTFKSIIRIVTYEDIQVKIQHTKYDPYPFLNNLINSHFRITSKQIKESKVNEYLIIFIFHRQSRSSMKSVKFSSNPNRLFQNFFLNGNNRKSVEFASTKVENLLNNF